MNEITAPAESLAVAWPTCQLCGKTHSPDDQCDPEWRVVRISDSLEASSEGPRYLVDADNSATRG
jgi:hypothetical protein